MKWKEVTTRGSHRQYKKHFFKFLEVIVFDRYGSYYIILNLVQTRFYSHHSKPVFISVTNDLHVPKCLWLIVGLHLDYQHHIIQLITTAFFMYFSLSNSRMPFIFSLSHWLLVSDSSSSTQTLNAGEPQSSVLVSLSSPYIFSFLIISFRHHFIY